MKFIPFYRCGCCNGSMTYGMPVEFTSEEGIQKGIEKMIQGQVYNFVPGVEDSLQTPSSLLHLCPDGSLGIAKFVGYHLLSTEECAVFEQNICGIAEVQRKEIR